MLKLLWCEGFVLSFFVSFICLSLSQWHAGIYVVMVLIACMHDFLCRPDNVLRYGSTVYTSAEQVQQLNTLTSHFYNFCVLGSQIY